MCVGSVGFFVKLFLGMVLVLFLFYNGYYNNGVDIVNKYGLGSYVFYGENVVGMWEVYVVSGVLINVCLIY